MNRLDKSNVIVGGIAMLLSGGMLTAGLVFGLRVDAEVERPTLGWFCPVSVEFLERECPANCRCLDCYRPPTAGR